MKGISQVEMRQRGMYEECKTGLNIMSVLTFNSTVLLVRIGTKYAMQNAIGLEIVG